MANKSFFNRAVLIAVLVLPALLYLFFVYGQNEVFFQTLKYVGPKTVLTTDTGIDTAYYEIPEFALQGTDGAAVTN